MTEEEIIKEIESLSPSEEAIQGILDLYNNEKEKNKLLEKTILEFVNDRERILKTPVISKDKIREKIEFYKRYGKIKNSNEYVMSVEIVVLQDLLEEE